MIDHSMTGQPLDLDAIRARWSSWYEDDPVFGNADWSLQDEDEDMSHCIVRQDMPLLLEEIDRISRELSNPTTETRPDGFCVCDRSGRRARDCGIEAHRVAARACDHGNLGWCADCRRIRPLSGGEA